MDGATMGTEFAELQRLLALLLPTAEADPLWTARVQALGQRLAQRVAEAPEPLLYALFQGAARLSERYSTTHALSCAALVELCALQLDWPVAERAALVPAALTMNIAITALQDELVHRSRTLTLDQRRLIDGHAAQGEALLERAGVDDALWRAAVGLHHGPDDAARRLEALAPAERLARLLARVDVFLAKLSPRAARKAMSATSAARAACLGPDGRPDEIGATLLRVVGFYPPGTLVRLACGEIAVVIRRGLRADQPVVASLADAARTPYAVPLERCTGRPEFAVQAAERADALPADAQRAERLASLLAPPAGAACPA